MSISTGLSLAKHGVYDFWEYEQTDRGPRAHVMTHRKGGKAIWNVLSEYGKQVVIANVPMTYPPEPINGIMLSGYMAPDMKANVTYPTSFKEELLEAVPYYQIDLDPAISGGQIGDPLGETLKMTRGRLAMFRLLLTKPWDFFFLACSGADRIQHLRWDQIMAFHPQAVEYYQMLDEMLGMALSTLNTEDLLLIVSDHGFQGVRRKFYIQEYLYRQGWLHMRDRGNRRRAELLGLARTLVRAMRLRRRVHVLRKRLRQARIIAVEKEHHTAAMPDLDWTRSRAYIPSSSGSIAGYADIILSALLNEADIKELVTALREVRDPETTQPLIAEAYREDAFGTGPFAPHERHLVVLANENISLPTELGRKSLWETSNASTGIHHPDGILYLYGAHVKKGATISPAHVYDVVPTILSIMGVPLPLELDGKVIEEAFEHPLLGDPGTKDESPVMRKLKRLSSHSI
jgi:predicted AlkP superfamily phosphohydrolase/phosphomutase